MVWRKNGKKNFGEILKIFSQARFWDFAFLGFWSLAEENALPESTQTKILH